MDEIIRQTERLWSKSKDSCDDASNSDARSLIDETRQVYEAAKMQKSPEHIIDRLKDLRQTLDDLRNRTDIYSPQDIDDMRDRCDDIRQLAERL